MCSLPVRPELDDPKKVERISLARTVSVGIPPYFLTIVLIIFALGCRFGSNILPPKSDSDATAESPATPQEPIFRDDFNGQLNPAWAWQNEDVTHYKINEDGWLEITGGSESILAGGQQTNLLWMQLPEGDFVISIHLKSQPLFDFQRAGILLFKNSEQYVSLSRGYCMQCVLGGSGIFLEYISKGGRTRYAVATDATDLYLMLIRGRGVLSGFYATEASQWQNIANLENDIRFERVALSVTNDSTWDEGYDVVGMFDYFEIRSVFHQKPAPLWDVTKVTTFLH